MAAMDAAASARANTAGDSSARTVRQVSVDQSYGGAQGAKKKETPVVRSPTRQSVFPLFSEVKSTKKASRAWLNLLKSKTSDEENMLSPYNQWLQESAAFESQPRQAWFKTIGKAPLEAPVRPARLTPVRLMSPTPPPLSEGPGAAPAANADASFGDDSGEEISSPRSTGSRRTLRKTFSRECCHVMKDQGVVMPFDAMKIYLACSFFAPCSTSFLRELLIVGGAPAWQGQSMNSGCTVYEEGDLGTSMYVLARGTAEALREGQDPKDARELGMGSHFGEAQVLGIFPRRGETVRAKSALHILEITPSTLTRLLKRTKAEDDAITSRALAENSCGSADPGKASAMDGGIGRALRLGGNAFAEERRHFESEAVRLYRQLVTDQLGTAAISSGGQNRPGRATKAYYARVISQQEDADGDSGAAPDGSGGSARSKEQEAPTRRVAQNPRRATSARCTSGDGQDSGTETAAAGAAGGSGDNPESTAASSNARERLVTHLVQSLRTDMRRGYMMPADSLGGGKRRFAGAKSKTKKSVTKRGVSTSAHKNASGRRGSIVAEPGGDMQEAVTRQLNENDDEEGRTNDLSAALDIQMLPPIGLLSPAQKHALLQQLRHDARAKVTHLLVTPGRKDRLDVMATFLRRETSAQSEAPTGVSFKVAPEVRE